jgi:hypothetical protein
LCFQFLCVFSLLTFDLLSGIATLSSTSQSLISIACYQPKLQEASSDMDRASVTFAFAFAIATFISTMVFLSAAKASAALVTYLVWGQKWCWCSALRSCKPETRSCVSHRDGSCGGLGFGVWRRLYEQL